MRVVSDSIKRSWDKIIYSQYLEHLYKLVEYAKRTLSLTGVSYLVTWRKAFMATRGKGWSHTLLMIRFLFTVSVSNAKLERMSSKLKHVKTNFCCSLVVKRLESYENYGR